MLAYFSIKLLMNEWKKANWFDRFVFIVGIAFFAFMDCIAVMFWLALTVDQFFK